MDTAKLRAILLLVFVMATWGLNIVAIKVLVENFPPLTITAFRILLAGIVVCLVVIFQQNMRLPTKKELLYTVGGGFTGILGHQYFLTGGLVHTTATNAALILALVPLATALLAMIFLKDKLTPLKLAGIILGLIGVVIIILQRNGSVGAINIGDIYIIGALLTQALSYMFIKKATDTLDAIQMTGFMLIIGSVLMFLLSFLIEPHGISQIKEAPPKVWIVFLLSAIVATGIGHIIYNTEVHELGVNQTAIFTNLVPFFSLVGAVIFLGEQILASQIIGLLLIVTGVALGNGYFNKKSKNDHLNRQTCNSTSVK